jgi:hypothetical protein
LFENIGVGVSLGAHPDIVQTEGGPWTTIIENFNMIWQSNNVSDVARYGTQGFGFDSAGTVDTFDNSYNVVVTSKAGSMNRFTAITPLYVTGLASTHDNYIDPSNLGKFAQAGSSAKNSKFSNNIDMLTGRNIPTFGSR